MTKMTMNINELADTLGVSVKAIYNRRNESPETLPKPLDIPGHHFAMESCGKSLKTKHSLPSTYHNFHLFPALL